MWIHRDLESRLQQLSRTFPAILVTGARQTGKTSLLQHAFPEAGFISLDLPSAAQALQEQPESIIADSANPVILDEVQYAPAVFRYLKLKIDQDRSRTGRFLMTGSQRFTLMEHFAETLAGRIAIIELDTLSSRELISANASEGVELLWRGGYPELYRNPQLQPRDFYSSYVATYLQRDVQSAVRAGSLRDFERFLRACATRSGKLVNYAGMATELGIAGVTVKSWMSILEAANVIAILEPWFGNIGKRMVKTPKLYFRDTGLLCFLLGFDSASAMAASSSIGPVWETFVVGQVLRQLESAGSAGKLFFYRDAYGREVDLVLERNGKLQLIEAKWTEAFNQPRSPQIEKVAEILKEKDLAAEHLIVARPSQDHRLSNSAVPTRVVNGFRYNFIAE